MKLITFMGIGPRHETVYRWKDHPDIQTAHFAVALAQWLKPKEILVMLTQQAQNHENWSWMQKWAESQQITLTPIAIPEGGNEAEQWQIFDAMTQALQPDDCVIFDITHGYRSLPMLALLGALYLRLVKNITVTHMLYGAFEARDQSVKPNIAPIVDMTEFLNLLDWVSGAEELIELGLSHRIGKLLSDTHKQLYISKTGKPQFLERAGSQLQNISNALQLAQPHHLAQSSHQLKERLANAGQEAHWVKPFSAIAEKIADHYSHFETQDLATQRELVNWYTQKGHWVQAVTLAREWVVSFICQQILQNPFPERTLREQVEQAWNGYIHKELSYRSKYKEKHGSSEALNNLTVLQAESELLKSLNLQEYLILQQIPALPTLKSIWEKLRDLRNQIAHCGMGRDAQSQPPESMIKDIQQQTQALNQISLEAK
ncbi:MAG: TIGR02221 family CRISPR-associated protein [Candidatus Sericytochromatia bacterium]|nr:TIGR02221 family CRISPR-associated protein [Candidatus Sericytochromatia bacterium]